MKFILGNNRHQTYFSTLEEQVAADNPVRLIDAFIKAICRQNKTLLFLKVSTQFFSKAI